MICLLQMFYNLNLFYFVAGNGSGDDGKDYKIYKSQNTHTIIICCERSDRIGIMRSIPDIKKKCYCND